MSDNWIRIRSDADYPKDGVRVLWCTIKGEIRLGEFQAPGITRVEANGERWVSLALFADDDDYEVDSARFVAAWMPEPKLPEGYEHGFREDVTDAQP